MIFTQPLVPGILVRRYKRFLADVELPDGSVVTAHCANTGSMKQVSDPGSPVMLTTADNPDRKTKWDWQLIMVNGLWAGINTSVPNMLLREGFETGRIDVFRGYVTISMEVKYGERNSRADAVLSGPHDKLFVEAKNVTLVENRRALFPDAVTARGAKHLEELAAMVRRGHRAAMFFLSQRMDSDSIGIAADIDREYARGIERAIAGGVEVIAWRAKVTVEGIELDSELPFIL
ncbi:DNA/RNA nuclease SfsA [bacterium]|nr:DNA/RNA nuclease SfsA [bacterium]